MNIYPYVTTGIITIVFGTYNLNRRGLQQDFSNRPIESVYYHTFIFLILPFATILALSDIFSLKTFANNFEIFYVLVVAPLVIQALVFYKKQIQRFRVLIIFSQIFSCFLGLTVILYAALNANPPIISQEKYDISIDDIQLSAKRINQNSNSLDSLIKVETDIINQNFEALSRQIKLKNNELNLAENEKIKYRKQSEFYKTLSNLNQDQAAAVIQQFEKSSNIYSLRNIIWTLISGIFIGVSSAYIFRYLIRKN